VKAPYRLALVAAVVLTTPALASCGVGFGAQTDQIYSPADGENNYDESVDVLNALVVSNTDGAGRIVAGLVNNSTEEADRLTEVTGADDEQGLTITLEGDGEIPAGGALQLADDDAPVVLVTGSEEQVQPGTFVRVTFSFENSEPVTLNIPVLDQSADYAEVEIPEATTTPAEG
jgi:hypothetical protein